MTRDKMVCILLTELEREAAQKAASALGYASVSDMLREAIEMRVREAKKVSDWFAAWALEQQLI